MTYAAALPLSSAVSLWLTDMIFIFSFGEAKPRA